MQIMLGATPWMRLMPPDANEVGWGELRGGYGQVVDPRPIVARLAAPDTRELGWELVWNDLHHQGDVGGASYAAVVLMARLASSGVDLGWQFLAFVATVERCRFGKGNEEMPDWLASAYSDAWRTAFESAVRVLEAGSDDLAMRCALSVLAMATRQYKLGVLLLEMDVHEVDDWLETRLAWSDTMKS